MKFLNHGLLQKEQATRPDAEEGVTPDFSKRLIQ